MKRKRLTKAEEEEYRAYCRWRYNIILFLYFWEECSKNYAYVAPLLLVYGYLPKIAVIIATPIAIVGSLVAFFAKWYQLKNMKFRKRDFYKRRK